MVSDGCTLSTILTLVNSPTVPDLAHFSEDHQGIRRSLADVHEEAQKGSYRQKKVAKLGSVASSIWNSGRAGSPTLYPTSLLIVRVLNDILPPPLLLVNSKVVKLFWGFGSRSSAQGLWSNNGLRGGGDSVEGEASKSGRVPVSSCSRSIRWLCSAMWNVQFR